MSSHETYEFFAIDRCLTPAEMRAVRAISTRATITPTRFYNYYDWGGLKGDPREMLRRWFDVFVYQEMSSGARWGMLRFPTDRIELRRWRPYVSEQRGKSPPARCASVATQDDVTILSLEPPEDTALHAADEPPMDDEDEDDDDWDDEDEEYDGPGYRGRYDDDADESVDEPSWPVPLALTRADLLAGDLRALYLMWLCAVQCGERRATTREPPRPEGLDRLTGMLHTLAEFLRINPDLLAVAIEAPSVEPRTVGALLRAAEAHAAERQRAEMARAAAARGRRLAALARREEDEWIDVERLVSEKKTNAYDEAVRRLLALRELSVDRGTVAAFRARLQALLDRHRSKSAFRERVRYATLLPRVP